MTDVALQDEVVGSGWLTELVAECLKLPAAEIDRQVPLVRYGLDSLGAVQLTMAIAAELRCDVPEALLLEHPDIRSLESFVQATRAASPGFAPRVDRAGTPLAQMLADSILPADVRPDRCVPATRPAGAVLLTGATGFLGAYLLRTLLRDTTARVYCLVRPTEGDARSRIRRALRRYAIWNPAWDSRWHVIRGDLQRPALGMPAGACDDLAGEIDEIYHCGAAVNWVMPYAELREANVLGTVALLRLACRGKLKPFHFVSSMAACYATTGIDEVTELDDTLPHLSGIHLGYAQSKCVAESLVRQASGRGLPATIHRPTLIAGDGESGISNEDDLLSVMIRGCIQMRAAPDLDWVLDCCPVDYAADAIVGLSGQWDDSLRVFHLANPAARHWREIVLWMNLFGYPIELISYRDWLAQLRTAAATPDHPLYRLRSFFLSRPPATGGLTLPELYEQHRRSRVCHARTRRALSALRLECPPLDARLLDRYFASFIQRQVLPGVAGAGREPAAGKLDQDFFQNVLRRHYGDDSLCVRELTTLREAWQDSITAELTSWRYGTTSGLSQHRVAIHGDAPGLPASLELFVKAKPRDQEVLDVAASVAAVCGDKIGMAFARHKHRIGITGCHARELGVYRQTDDRFRRHAPRVFGTVQDEARREWILVLENLSSTAMMGSAADAGGWQPGHIEQALRGIAEVHSIWYGRERELLAQQWLGPTMSAAAMEDMADLWTALADYAARYFRDWIDTDTRPLVKELSAGVGQWWRAVERLPRTLIHNDFNPRNIALCDDRGGLRLCVYDWELATLGIPQRDLAELLCFVLPADCSRNTALHYIELHREALSRAGGGEVDDGSWRLGFQLALRDLILNRLPMYCLLHTFRPQPFLARVVRTWARLFELFGSDP